MTRGSPSLRRRVALLRALADRYAVHLLALAAAALVFVVATQLFPYHSANHDEAVYLQQAAMLLDGHLTLTPPVADAFRPWFFVADGDVLYSKYSPVTAAIFAIPLAVGVPRLALAVVAAAIVVLTVSIGAKTFDRRTGLLAGALLLASPLFVLDSATFLPYAPTTALNLTFAYAYLRAETPAHGDRTNRTRVRWAALAGAAIGLAFFARPYTAVLFAAPFIGHAGWTLRTEYRANSTPSSMRILLARRLATAGLGLAGVLLALTYNWHLTGDPLLFPYEAFAPLDGLGFGHRELVGGGIEYTPTLAARSTVLILERYLLVWGPLGVLGSAFAARGLLAVRHDPDWRRVLLAGVAVSVVVGNAYFWGNHNLLGDLSVTGDGFVATLGPYYHFDLLLPTSLFAAHGIAVAWRGLRDRVTHTTDERTGRRVFAAIAVATLLVTGTATVAAFDGPLDRNATVTDEYAAAYAPFEDDGPTTDAVVFLPPVHGPWLNHPFQALRNEPGFDGPTVYALPEHRFRVVDAYPDRAHYRYVYRGTWNPYDGSPVTPTLQRVHVVRGERVTADASVVLPSSTTTTSMRLSTSRGYAYYTAPATDGTQQISIVVDEDGVRLEGPGAESTGTGQVPIASTDEVVVELNANTEGGDVLYRLVLPVDVVDGEPRALTPTIEVCSVARLCGGEGAVVPDAADSAYTVNVTMHAE